MTGGSHAKPADTRWGTKWLFTLHIVKFWLFWSQGEEDAKGIGSRG